jgi:Rrf2 family protein
MRFTAQEEYGLRCLLQLARNTDPKSGRVMTIVEIAEAESLSPAYAAKLLRILRQAKLVESTRGHQGGYRVARPADRVSMAEVLGALDGKLYTDEFCDKYAGNDEACVHLENCSLRSLWGGLERLVYRILDECKLSDLLRNERGMAGWLEEHLPAVASLAGSAPGYPASPDADPQVTSPQGSSASGLPRKLPTTQVPS